MTHHLTSLLAAAFAGSLAAGSVGCNAVECGAGTVEKDGVCELIDNNPDDAQCGPGTKLGPAGTCIPEREVICDEDTTDEQVNPTTGVVTCMGTSAGMGCAAELPCPPPTDGMITICGRLRDSETDQPIAAVGATGAACDLGNPTQTGPCSIELVFVDALDFALDPSTATPHIPAGGLTIDDCGRYRAVDLPLSGNGFTGIAVDDAMSVPDNHKLTGVALDDDNAKPARGFGAYATRNETDVMWHTTSGIGGATFAARGVLAAVFRHVATPVAGVQIRRGGQPIVADDFYFSDTVPSMRSTVSAALNVTGVNGAALAINPASTGVASHDGTGSEPATCRWPNSLAAAIPGVVFMQIKVAETSGGAECP